ncbi:MAG: panthothenate synthetase [Acidobacteriota bacterium]|nr:panthothenate synthetase [Acidobacteriota bacterium]
MRMLLIAKNPPGKFNAGVRDGSSGQKLVKIIEDLKPEAVYFTEIDGRRTAVLVVDLKDASEIPKYAEPFFLNFESEVHFHPVMTPEDLGRAGLEELGKKWG